MRGQVEKEDGAMADLYYQRGHLKVELARGLLFNHNLWSQDHTSCNRCNISKTNMEIIRIVRLFGVVGALSLWKLNFGLMERPDCTIDLNGVGKP